MKEPGGAYVMGYCEICPSFAVQHFEGVSWFGRFYPGFQEGCGYDQSADDDNETKQPSFGFLNFRQMFPLDTEEVNNR